MKVRLKPEVFEAEQFFPDKKPWPLWVNEATFSETGYSLHDVWTKGWTTVYPGQWIIEDFRGRRIVCSDESFKKGFQPAIDEINIL